MLLAADNSLDALVAALASTSFDADAPEPAIALVRAARISVGDLHDRTWFVPGRYTRNLIFRNDDFELLILCWAIGAGSPVHDHGGRHCTMSVLHGSLRVDDYVILSGGQRQGYAHIAPAGSTRLVPGALDVRTSRRDLHRVCAPDEPAISLHLYAKPIDRFMVFHPQSRSCRTVFSRYDSRPATST